MAKLAAALTLTTLATLAGAWLAVWRVAVAEGAARHGAVVGGGE